MHPRTRTQRSRPPRSRAISGYDYQRAYKACIPCRRRKVKCELEGRGRCSRCEKKNLLCQFTEKVPWDRGSGQVDGVRAEDGDEETGSRISRDNGQAQTERIGLPSTALKRMVSSGNDALNILFEAAQDAPHPPIDNSSKADAEVLRVWEACRFVRMGWFSAQEAVILVDLFFKNMSPLSPILSNFYSSPHNHYWLVTHEPMLCCTVLMISSRYHVLPGPGGASRGYFIHNRLWQHCQHLILRVILGQEKISKAKTRHLGSIEAFLLILEWYPRSLHFFPENDGWDADMMLTAPDERDPPPDEEMPTSDRWKEDVVEPTRRSDRMSWMLVSSALALGHELGVFDPVSQRRGGLEGVDMRPGVEVYLDYLEERRQRLPCLLLLFMNLVTSRIGCASLISETQEIEVPLGDPEWGTFMVSWIDLTRLTKGVTEEYFPTGKPKSERKWDTRSLEGWKSKLSTWQDKCPELNNPQFNDILHIEYQHLRVFINSIEMQSFVESVLSQTDPTKPLSPSTFTSQSPAKTHPFSTEVIAGSRSILTHLITLSKSNPLKYLPMRIFLRVISSSILLLKALALGTTTSTLHDSLNLLDQTIITLQSTSLDDIYIVSRYATLLQIHVSRVRQTFASKDAGVDSESEEVRHVDSTWDSTMGLGDLSDEWLSLPFDPLMAPFGTWDEGVVDGLEAGCLDLDFIWNLPA